jgi:peroxiredoxin
MKYLNKILLSLFLLFYSFQLFSAPEGYLINFRIKGLKDTTCLIANYYGNGTYVKDTLKVDKNGRFTFKGPADLPRGMYLIVITDKNYFEVVINDDRKFSIETEILNPQNHMVIKGSPENQLFYEYLKFNKQAYEDLKSAEKEIKEGPNQKDSVKLIMDKTKEINTKIMNYRMDVLKEHPQSFLALLINVMKEPDIPAYPVLPDGKKDSLYPYRYVKAHFWDGTDFTDDRVLRTPVFHNKLKKYFDMVLIQNPDTIIKEGDIFIEKSRPNHEMFKYLVWFLTNHYENSEYMGFEKIFVYDVEKYYETGQADWVNKTVLENMIKKAKKQETLLIGKVAPEMVMMDTNQKLVSMHSVDANILLLFFWDPDCGHCEQEIPKLKEFYDQDKALYGLEIFAVCSDSSMAKMKSAIKKRDMHWINVNGPRTLTGDFHNSYDVISTPVIYVLNRKKEIIAKQLRTDQISSFLKHYIINHPLH